MNTKVLFTGGRAPATLDLARQLKRQGYEVYVAESESCSISRRSNVFTGKFRVAKPNAQHAQFIADVLHICESHEIATVIPTCEETFHLAKAMDQFAARGIRLFTSPIETLGVLHNKFTFIELAKRLDLPVPLTFEASSHLQLEEARRAIEGRCIIKPVYSRFSESVYMLDPADPLPNMSISPEQPWVVQQYIGGTQYCSYSVAHQGELAAHGCYATQYAYGHATVYFEAVQHAGIEAFVTKIIAHFGFTGQISFDFIVQDDGSFYPIECNPRTTSGVHVFSSNVCFPRTFFAPIEGRVLRPLAASPRMLGLAMLRHVVRTPRAWLAFWRGRDVLWSWRDPLPAIDQFVVFAQLLLRARKQHVSVITLLTEDIQWGGE